MSDRATSDISPYSMVPEWITRADISDRAVRLFAILGRYANSETGAAFPRRQTLATAIRTSRSGIDRAIKELAAIGAVEVEQRHDAAGDQMSNLYRLRYASPVTTPLVTSDDTPLVTGDETPSSPVTHITRAIGTSTPVSEETGRAAEPLRDSAPAVLTFPTVGETTRWVLTQGALDGWSAAYPNLDVRAEAFKAHAWIVANLQRRKTAKGMPAFIVNWLNRAADRRGSQPTVVSGSKTSGNVDALRRFVARGQS